MYNSLGMFVSSNILYVFIKINRGH